jgi:hypothetical protein
MPSGGRTRQLLGCNAVGQAEQARGDCLNHTIRATNSAVAREMKPTYPNFYPRPLGPGLS